MSVCPVILADTVESQTRRPLRIPKVINEYRRPPRQVVLYNDVSRHELAVDELHQGIEVGNEIIPFTGKGVVIGMVDSGIDPRHPAFVNSETGGSRIALYITTKSVNEGSSAKFTYNSFRPMEGEAVAKRFVDFGAGGHGTHTSATASGVSCGTPYQGMAPDATIVMTSMGDAMYDDEIAFGITSALDYARENNMPCVTSLSIGSCSGLHDGTSMTTDLLESELDDAGQIICFAAGNDGDSACSISRDFSADSSPLATALYRSISGNKAAGANTVFVSSSDDMQIAFSLVEIGPKNYGEVWRSPYFNYNDFSVGANGILSECPQIKEHLSGSSYLVLYRSKSKSGIYAMEIDGFFDWVPEMSNYTLGVILNSPSGAEINGFTEPSSSAFGSFDIEGYTSGDASQSISDHCTSPYVISVGAVNGRLSYTSITGEECPVDQDFYGPYKATAAYASYGTIPEKLPHTTAPGTMVISALNDRSNYPEVCKVKDADGLTWRYGAAAGTSMSTPAISGMIALWLQANPSLTRQDVLELLEYSADPDYGADKARFGVPSAYKGLKRILETTSVNLIPGVLPESNANTPLRLMVKYLDSNLVEAVVPFPTTGGTYTLYSADGRMLSQNTFDGATFSVELPSRQGLCVLTVTTPQGTATQKLTTK